MKAISTPQLLIFGLGVLALVAALLYSNQPQQAQGAIFPSQGGTVPTLASTTAIALSGSSRQILATSTASTTDAAVGGRVAVQLQPINCTAGASVFLAYNDVAAVGNTGSVLLASSTTVYGDSLPMVHGSIRAINSGGTCTLLVTEFRSENF